MRVSTPFLITIAGAMLVGWATQPLDGWRSQILVVGVIVIYLAAKYEGQSKS